MPLRYKGILIGFIMTVLFPGSLRAETIEDIHYRIEQRTDLAEDYLDERGLTIYDWRNQLSIYDDDLLWLRMNAIRSSEEKAEDPYWGNNLKN